MAGRLTGCQTPPVFDELYDRARRRTSGIVAGLDTPQLATVVPATPLWTARDVLGHLAGVASDMLTGHTTDMPGPAWTAAQVSRRADLTPSEVLQEWTRLGPQVCRGLVERRIGTATVHDVLTHEADLREAFGLDPLPADDLAAALDDLARTVTRRSRTPVVLRAAGRSWGRGSLTAETEPYALYRGLLSRLHGDRMRRWAWSADPGPLIDELPVFGPA
jgi:uncharacterized protein (TIGR03083 family)